MAVEDYGAELHERLRTMEIAAGEATVSCLPRLLSRLRDHEVRLLGNPMIGLWRRWRIRRLAVAAAEARPHVEDGRFARIGTLCGGR